MKKIFQMILVMIVMVCIAGCSAPIEQEATDNKKTDQVLTEKTEDTASIQENDSVEQDNEVDSLKNPFLELYNLDIPYDWDREASELKENDEWIYYICKKGDLGAVKIYNYKGTDRNLVIPDTIEGYPVISVLPNPKGYSRFEPFTTEYPTEEITDIYFPDSVYQTKEYLFNDTVWYHSQPDGEIYINKVFLEYKGESPANTEINLKDGTLSICTFNNCDNIIKITMPDSVLEIDVAAFANCDNLEEIQFSKNLILLHQRMFADCPKLREIYLPKTLSERYNAFEDCTLQKVYFEGTKSEWDSIFPAAYQELHPFELETEVPFPY